MAKKSSNSSAGIPNVFISGTCSTNANVEFIRIRYGTDGHEVMIVRLEL